MAAIEKTLEWVRYVEKATTNTDMKDKWEERGECSGRVNSTYNVNIMDTMTDSPR